MPADPVEAGRKGGRSRSAAKLAAARRNGFQPRKPAAEQPAPPATVPQPVAAPVSEQAAAPVDACVRPAPRAFFLRTPRNE